MIPTDKSKFIKQLVGLAAIKPGKSLTEEAYEIWWLAMQDWSLEDFTAAAAQLARSVEFMPSPFHFEQLRKAGRPTAGEAWIAALEYARKGWTRWGDNTVSQMPAMKPPADPLIAKAVQAIGGYEAIAMSPADKTHFLEQRFAQNYDSMQDAHEIREALPQLTQASSTRRLNGAKSTQELLARSHPNIGPVENDT